MIILLLLTSSLSFYLLSEQKTYHTLNYYFNNDLILNLFIKLKPISRMNNLLQVTYTPPPQTPRRLKEDPTDILFLFIFRIFHFKRFLSCLSTGRLDNLLSWNYEEQTNERINQATNTIHQKVTIISLNFYKHIKA